MSTRSDGVMKQFKTVGIVAATIVSTAAALAVFDVNIPRPAWSSELMKLAGNLIELDSRVTSQQLDDTKLQYYQNLREQEKYDSGTKPDYLVDEQILLESRIDGLKNRLDELRAAD